MVQKKKMITSFDDHFSRSSDRGSSDLLETWAVVMRDMKTRSLYLSTQGQ